MLKKNRPTATAEAAAALAVKGTTADAVSGEWEVDGRRLCDSRGMSPQPDVSARRGRGKQPERRDAEGPAGIGDQSDDTPDDEDANENERVDLVTSTQGKSPQSVIVS